MCQRHRCKGHDRRTDIACAGCTCVSDMRRCPCDECYISHIITCGLISPEVNEQHHHHHHHHQHHHHHRDAELQQAPGHDSTNITYNGDTGRISPSRMPRPLTSTCDSLQSYYANIKPPSLPSSSSSSCSESPTILDRCRFFGENFEYVVFCLFVAYQLIKNFYV